MGMVRVTINGRQFGSLPERRFCQRRAARGYTFPFSAIIRTCSRPKEVERQESSSKETVRSKTPDPGRTARAAVSAWWKSGGQEPCGIVCHGGHGRDGRRHGHKTIRAKRQENLVPIMARHPHACLTCAQQEGCSLSHCSSNVLENERCCATFGHCELQKVAAYVGISPERPSGSPRSPNLDQPLSLPGTTTCASGARDVCERAATSEALRPSALWRTGTARSDRFSVADSGGIGLQVLHGLRRGLPHRRLDGQIRAAGEKGRGSGSLQECMPGAHGRALGTSGSLKRERGMKRMP